MPFRHCKASQILGLDRIPLHSFPIPHGYLQGTWFLSQQRLKTQFHKDNGILRRNLVYCLEQIDHVVLDRCGESLWVFQTLCLSPGSVPWLKTLPAQVGTLALRRNHPSSTLPFCTAHLALNTLYFVSELTACTGLMSTTRSPALWSSETIPCTHLAQKRTHFVLHRKRSAVICGMCGLKKVTLCTYVISPQSFEMPFIFSH